MENQVTHKFKANSPVIRKLALAYPNKGYGEGKLVSYHELGPFLLNQIKDKCNVLLIEANVSNRFTELTQDEDDALMEQAREAVLGPIFGRRAAREQYLYELLREILIPIPMNIPGILSVI